MNDIFIIPLTNSKIVSIASIEDREEILKYKWWYSYSDGYVYRTTDEPMINEHGYSYMAKFKIVHLVLGYTLWIDHINRVKLDNRRSNLRIGDRSKNVANIAKQEKSTSKYRGTFWHKRDKVWLSSIGHNGKLKHLGTFKNEIDAAKAYDIFATRYFGDFAQLNFPSNTAKT